MVSPKTGRAIDILHLYHICPVIPAAGLVFQFQNEVGMWGSRVIFLMLCSENIRPLRYCTTFYEIYRNAKKRNY